jgi:hypothetical protein
MQGGLEKVTTDKHLPGKFGIMTFGGLTKASTPLKNHGDEGSEYPDLPE